MLQQLKAPKLPFRELDVLVKAIGECRSKAEEDRIIGAEVDTLKQRLSDPKLDKTRGREYMVRVIYCEMLGHDASFAYIPALQLASDPNLLTKKAAYLALTQLLDYNHELVLLLVNTLLSDLKSDNFVVVSTALVVCSKLIGPDLINAVLPLVIERLTHHKEAVRKKAVMALHHFYEMDPNKTGALAGMDIERHFRTTLCDKEPSVMAATLNALYCMAGVNPAPFRQLIPSLTSILKQVVEHRLPKAYDYHRFPAPFIQIKLLKLLRVLGASDKASSDNMSSVIHLALKRAAGAGNHTIGHAIVYEAVRTITELYPNPQLLASAAESVAVLIKSSSHNLKYCGLNALAAITRVSPKYAQEHQVAVIDCLEDPDETLKLKTLELLVTMTKSNNVQVVVERLMTFLRSTSCGGDEVMRRHIAGQIVDLAEKYAPDTTWFVEVMAEVFEVGGDVLQPQLAHNLCRLIAEQDSDLHLTAVKMFIRILNQGGTTAAAAAAAAAAGSSEGKGSGVLPEILLNCICWVLGEYGTLAAQLPPPYKATPGQISDKLCAAVSSAQASPITRAYLITAITKLAAQQTSAQSSSANLLGGAPAAAAAAAAVLRPEADDLLNKSGHSSVVELQQRAQEARALLKLPPHVLATVLPLDSSCEEFEQTEIEEARNLTFLEGYINNALANGAQPYNPPPDMIPEFEHDLDLENLGLPGSTTAAAGSHKPHALRFNAYETAQAPTATTAASAAASGFGSGIQQQQRSGSPAAAVAVGAAAAAASVPQQQQQPSLKLRGADRGRWGPTEFASSSSSVAPPAAAQPAAALSSTSSRPSAASSSSSSSRDTRGGIPPEKSKLAASLFGSGEESAAAARGGIRSGARSPAAAAAAAKPAAAAPLVDLLGEDLSAPSHAPAAAAAAAAPAAKNDLDLLMDLDAPAQAVAPAAAAAAAAAPLDMLGDLAPSPPPAAPAAGGNASTGAGSLLDLDGLFGAPAAAPAAAAAAGGSTLDNLGVGFSSMGLSGPSAPQQQQQQIVGGLLVAAAAGGSLLSSQPQQQQQQQQQGTKPGGGMAMRGGQPAKGSHLANDPFGDLLG